MYVVHYQIHISPVFTYSFFNIKVFSPVMKYPVIFCICFWAACPIWLTVLAYSLLTDFASFQFSSFQLKMSSSQGVFERKAI